MKFLAGRQTNRRDPIGRSRWATVIGIVATAFGWACYTPSSATAADVIMLGRGAVRLTVPAGWRPYEAAAGREMRLLLAPPNTRPSTRLADGLWLSCRLDPRAKINAERWERHVLKLVGPQSRILGRQAIRHQTYKALRIDFESRHTPPNSEPLELTGFHLVVFAPWGQCELHAVAPQSLMPHRRPFLNQVLAGLQLSLPPAALPAAPPPSVQAAALILGNWKAHGSRFQLRADGRVIVTADDPHPRPLDEMRPAKSRPIEGMFHASRDVLYVTWQDGSRLNLRWRYQDGTLLLTDHDGRISELRRMWD